MVVVLLTVSIIIITVTLVIHYRRRRRLVLPNLDNKVHKRSKENSYSSVGSQESCPKYLDSLDPGYDEIKPIKKLDKGSTGSKESSMNEDVDDDSMYSTVGRHNRTTYFDVSSSASTKPTTRLCNMNDDVTSKLPNDNLNVNGNQSADDVQTASEDHSLAESKCNEPRTYAVVDFKKKKGNRDTERITTNESGHISDEVTPPPIPCTQLKCYTHKYKIRNSSEVNEDIVYHNLERNHFPCITNSMFN